MDQVMEYVPGKIWILEYPVRFAGMDLFGRTTIIRLENGDLIVHDPCVVTENIKAQIDDLGVTKYIIAPGTYHHLYVAEFQEAYPDAETFLCPGLERKADRLHAKGNRSPFDQRTLRLPSRKVEAPFG